MFVEATLNEPSIFPHTSNTPLPHSLLNSQVEAECNLYRQVPISLPNQNEVEYEPILLQLIENYVVQRTINRTHVLSYVLCHYNTQFEIKRKPSQAAQKLGEASGIRFVISGEKEMSIQLSVRPENRRQLQMFGRILGRKFIVQLGFHQSFKAKRRIGKGMTACVYSAINFANGQEVAIKSFKRSVYFTQDNGNGRISFLNQFKILTLLNHKNLCQMLGVYETENSTYLIMELYPLSLYGYIQKCGFPSLEKIKFLMINLLEGINYLHQKGIMHRDLKLENIMVRKENEKIVPVVVDFGLAEYCSSSKYMYTRCGTPGYVAPQVLKIKSTDQAQTYTCACDIFSLGVIFFILLFRKPLFEGKDAKEVIRKNTECFIDLNGQPMASVSEDCRDLLKQMLNPNPSQRITARDALNHPFLVDDFKRLQVESMQSQNTYQTQYSIWN